MGVEAFRFEAELGDDLDELARSTAGDLAGGFVFGALVVLAEHARCTDDR